MGSPVWMPHESNAPQILAYASEADEMLFGGSAGGGKSDLLLGSAFTQHKKSVIFRRQKSDTKGLIDRGEEILGNFGRWSAKSFSYKTNDGRELEFGHCNHVGDEEGWQGRPHDLKGFDELAHFTKAQYIFLSAWNRSADPEQKCQVIAGSNPPTSAEGAWIIERWAPWLDDKHANPAVSGELRWFATLNGVDTEVAGPEHFEHTDKAGNVEIIRPRSRTFISAGVDDNPYYRDSGYKAVLQALPEPLRSILLYGRFDAAMEDDPWQVVPSAWVDAAMARWKPEKPGPMDTVGVDVAMGGRDSMTLARRHDIWFDEIINHPGTEVPTGVAAAGLVVQALRDGAAVNIDTIGVGVACFEHLVESLGIPAAAMDARHKSDARDRAGVLGFFNKRAEWHWKFREALDPETGSNLCLPPSTVLKADLCAAKWEPTPRGIKVELKENVVARLGRSPDEGDAVIMAWAEEVPKSKLRQTGRVRVGSCPAPASDYDEKRY